MDWIDVSVTVRDGTPHWPGHPMICLPVKRHGNDGAPARPMLRPIGPGQPVSAQAAR